MDVSKIDRLYQALSAALLVESTEEAATSYEVMTVGMRLFSHLLAAYVADTPADSHAARSHAIDAYCRDAAGLAKDRLREVSDYDPSAEDEEDKGSQEGVT